MSPAREAASEAGAGLVIDPVPAAAAPDVETSSAAYASRFAGASGAYLLEVQACAVRRAVAGVTPGTVLDVGGGHGQLAPLLRAAGWSVTVHGTHRVCHENLTRVHGVSGCSFLQGPLEPLPAADGAFDLVVAVRLLSHVERWAALLGELCRVARRAVLIDYPSQRALNALTPLLFPLKRSIEGNTRTYRSFKPAELAQVLRGHGFEPAMEVKQFCLPMALHRAGRGHHGLQWLERVAERLGVTGRLGSPVILRADRIPAQ